ncbi:MAG: CmcJ/NvfI family oxidoreductase [Pseudomonadota bacterium]
MIRTAQVNYHVSSPHEQAYHIDADGEQGKIVSPELAVTEIPVRDVRGGGVSTDFRSDSVAFLESVSEVPDFEAAAGWEEAYNCELSALLTRETGAKEAIVFDHTVRVDDPKSGRKPARNVHSDYSPSGAHQRLRDLLDEETAAQWEQGHFAFINVWRPVENPINSAPLGFVRPASVAPEDWVMIKLIYPDRIGQIMGLVGNPDHEWLYMSKMTPNEVAFFNIYDNRGLASVAHSAMDMVEDSSVTVPRKSIESRTLVRY